MSPRCALLGGLALALVALSTQTAPATEQSRTIGLAITDIRYALYETPGGASECPEGLQVGENEQNRAMPDFRERMARFGGTTQNRGPNGELPNYSPMNVPEPLPWRELRTDTGYGLNLDGTADGHATEATCAHEKFTSPEGERVDNQMARVLGCVQGWRSTGFMAEFYSNEVQAQQVNRALIEITDVDDERNDSDVGVAVYKGRDRLVRTSGSNTFVPFMSHRIDHRAPELMFRTRGRIVDGVLTTDPMPELRMAVRQVEIYGERRMHNARLRLRIDAEAATGVLAGYEDIESWWGITSKGPGGGVGRYSAAHMYQAALRHADGDRDPATGQCSSISTTYNIAAVRALIVHPDERMQTAEAGR